MNDEQIIESAYKIGAVSRLTGVPADTLRVWERRYGVVSPHRTEGGNRLYSESDIDRLGIIKMLVDNGHAIGTVANLSIEQLKERAENTQLGMARQEQQVKSGPIRLAIVGSTLPYRLEMSLSNVDSRDIQLAGTYTDAARFEEEAEELVVDILLLEYPTIGISTAQEVRRLQQRCHAGRSLVVYTFGASDWAQSLEERGITTLRFPVGWDDVQRACCPGNRLAATHPAGGDIRTMLSEPAPKRVFTDAQLARVSNASVAIKCECPHHLADLVMNLSRFEQYSAECENLTRDDAAIHAYLHNTTAHARSIMEEALEKLMELEGIEVE